MLRTRNVLDGYTLVDFRASYAVSDSLEVFGRIENAFDEDYETIAPLRHARAARSSAACGRRF